jgi:hypothetical protein
MPRIIVTKEERRRRERYRVAAGLADFIATVLGVLLVIVMVMLLVALIKWICAEFLIDMASLLGIFNDALIMPE